MEIINLDNDAGMTRKEKRTLKGFPFFPSADTKRDAVVLGEVDYIGGYRFSGLPFHGC